MAAVWEGEEKERERRGERGGGSLGPSGGAVGVWEEEEKEKGRGGVAGNKAAASVVAAAAVFVL